MSKYEIDDFTKVIAGDIGLSLTDGPGRYTIPAGLFFIGDQNPWQHAFLGVGDGEIVEARPPHARVTKAHTNALYFRLPLTDLQRDYIADRPRFDLKEGDIKYAWSPFLYMGLLRMGFKANWLKRQVAGSRARLCSQLVDDYISLAGFSLLEGVEIGNCSPGDLAFRLGNDPSIQCFRIDGQSPWTRPSHKGGEG